MWSFWKYSKLCNKIVNRTPFKCPVILLSFLCFEARVNYRRLKAGGIPLHRPTASLTFCCPKIPVKVKKLNIRVTIVFFIYRHLKFNGQYMNFLSLINFRNFYHLSRQQYYFCGLINLYAVNKKYSNHCTCRSRENHSGWPYYTGMPGAWSEEGGGWSYSW